MIASIVEYGTQSAPSSGTAVVTTGTLRPGIYKVTVYATITGTVTVVDDLNNIELLVGASVISQLTFTPSANVTTALPPITVSVPEGGATISVAAVGNAGASAVYSAMLVADPIAIYT